MGKIKIFIADDHAILREGLCLILQKETQYQVVGEASDGRNALEKIERIKPDIAILDIAMPSMSGLEVGRQLRKCHPEIKIILLSHYDNEEYIKQMLKHRMHAYILKENASLDLLRAIAEVLNGNVYLSPAIAKKMVMNFSDDEKDISEKNKIFNELSNREQEILKLIVEGKSNYEIGSLLFISDKTVNVHRANIMRKLNIHKAVDLVKYAMKNGLID